MIRITIYSILLSILLISCSEESKEINASNQQPDLVQAMSNDPLPSWNEGKNKKAILEFVSNATKKGSTTFIPVTDRIAVFDNDGTLWPEQPVPNQFMFAVDNLKALATTHPEFKKDPILKGVLDNDLSALKEAGMVGLLKLVNASHANQTEEAFNKSVRNWIDTARDTKFHKPYKKVIYQPMVELLNHLRKNEFKTFIVSGGGADFMRVWSEEAYGIPSYQVIGSYGEVKYEVVDGKPVITKTAGATYMDDKAGKPQAIHQFIGKVPVFCAGNSDGDQAMMQYTSGSKYKSMCMILHHTDSIREYKYDVKTLSGHLETALVEAKEKNWLVVDMKSDFKKIFKFE